MQNKRLSIVAASAALAAAASAPPEHPEMWKRRLASLLTHPKVPPPIKSDVKTALDEIEAQKKRIIELETMIDTMTKERDE